MARIDAGSRTQSRSVDRRRVVLSARSAPPEGLEQVALCSLDPRRGPRPLSLVGRRRCPFPYPPLVREDPRRKASLRAATPVGRPGTSGETRLVRQGDAGALEQGRRQHVDLAHLHARAEEGREAGLRLGPQVRRGREALPDRRASRRETAHPRRQTCRRHLLEASVLRGSGFAARCARRPRPRLRGSRAGTTRFAASSRSTSRARGVSPAPPGCEELRAGRSSSSRRSTRPSTRRHGAPPSDRRRPPPRSTWASHPGRAALRPRSSSSAQCWRARAAPQAPVHDAAVDADRAGRKLDHADSR